MGKRDENASTDRGEIEALRERVRSGQLSARDAALVDRLLGLLLTLISVVESKNLSIKRTPSANGRDAAYKGCVGWRRRILYTLRHAHSPKGYDAWCLDI